MLTAVGLSGLFFGCGTAPGDSSPSDETAQAEQALFRSCPSDVLQQPDGSYEKLSDTGLYCDIDRGRIRRGVSFYEPEFTLWADGATKRRFLDLPPGSQIDTSNMDGWVFPVGTRVWKEFSLEGRKLETRLLEKRAEGSWFAMAFVWNEDETDAFPAPAGAPNVSGTPHDVPSVAQCTTCHRGAADTLLSVSALQLAGGNWKGVTLAALAWTNHLTNLPDKHVRFPGNHRDRAALGYLHANCGGCHGGARPFAGLNLSTSVNDESVTDTQVYKTAVGKPLTRWTGHGYDTRIVPGSPEESGIIARMSNREVGNQMPPLGTEIVDEEGVARVGDWISRLEPAPPALATDAPL